MSIPTNTVQNTYEDSWREQLAIPDAAFEYQYDLQTGLPTYIMIRWKKLGCRVMVKWTIRNTRRYSPGDPLFDVDWEQTHNHLVEAAEDLHEQYNEVTNETTRTCRPAI